MATNLEERIAKSKERTARLEQLRRAEQRKEREAQRKKDQRRDHIVGELVTRYFPEVRELEPGTKAENLVRFKPLESLLMTLSADPQLLKMLKEKAARNSLPMNEKERPLASDCPKCVSGHGHRTGSAYALKGGDGRG